MSYLIFARKYRPQTFNEVVGQEHIVRTLKQAVEEGRVAQSFLFTGSRGVGKTSLARILAKALNCQKGPTIDPCGKCVPCTEIATGSSLDTLEIDGASNRGIDEIRSLREQVKFRPSYGRYRVYIIDEVHMLTPEAFNALLKTLEEPPEHVKFVFATTEPAKVPITVVSRCQRYHFKPIPLRQIKEKLVEICREEKLKAGDDVLFLLAKAAEGSLRDAESLLDQLASFSAGELTVETALDAFGLTSSEHLLATLDDFSERNSANILDRIDCLVEEGRSLAQFVDGLSEALRNLLIFQTVKEPERLIEASDEFLGELKKRHKDFSREDLLFMLQVLTRASSDLKRSETPRLILEVVMIELTTREPLRALSEILEEVRTLKTTGNIAPSQGAMAQKPLDSQRSLAGVEIRKAGLKMPIERPGARAQIAKGSIENLAEQENLRSGFISTNVIPAQGSVADRTSNTESCRGEVTSPLPKALPKSSATDPPSTATVESEEISLGPQLRSEQVAMATLEAGDESGLEVEEAPPAGGDDEAAGFSLAKAEALWPSVLERVKAKKMSTGNYLAEAELMEVEDGILVLGMQAEAGFHKEALERKEHLSLIQEICEQVFERSVQIKFVITRPAGTAPDSTLGCRPAGTRPGGQVGEIRNKTEKLPPIVESAQQMFGGKVVRRRMRL